MATGETFPGYSKYGSDAGGVYSIRLSSDALTVAANTPPAGAYTDARVKVSVSGHGRKRLSGIKARGLVLGLPISAGSSTDTSKTFLAIRTKTAWDGINIGDSVTYQTGTWIVRDKISEV